MTKRSARSSTTTPATRHLDKLGIPYKLHSYDFDPGDLGIGEQAANALGIATDRIFKTLMVKVDDKSFAVALVPVHAETQMKALAAALDGKRAAMASIKEAERITGYVKGGISPFGQRQRQPTIVDHSAVNHETIYANGGKRGLQIELAPNDLVEVLGAILVNLAR